MNKSFSIILMESRTDGVKGNALEGDAGKSHGEEIPGRPALQRVLWNHI